MDDKTEKLNLKREVGLVGAVSLISGTMIGSGIFMSPQTVLSTIGSPGASLVVWACCGLLVIMASFCYAELGTVIRESGGEYIYILKTSGPVVAFMLIFSSVLFVRPAGVAGISLSFAQYVVAPFYTDCPPPLLLVKGVAAVSILVLATVNCLNVRFAMKIQVFFMVAKLLGLVVIIIGGLVMLIRGHTENFENSFENTNLGLNPIGIAFYQGLWSYDGWNNLNYVTEELKRPEFVLAAIGSPGASFIIWTLCGFISMLAGLCYAELGTVIPESGGEFIYILRTAGKVVAFMFSSASSVMRPASATGVALSFAEYVVAPFYSGCTPPILAVKCIAAAAIMGLTAVNCLSGHTENFEEPFENTNADISSIGIAFYQGLWSFGGWNTLNYLTEELKNPENSMWMPNYQMLDHSYWF
ncbi:b(0+)-type amino acid transporter 1 [Dissostichus eleginoides]|uniref:B(0+)-type amino acid transporter 1 n=1 Tax=Dissostichus eleginoides TaxID=100907 RepID=A0AAD9FA38_DISEL|nr:b(0+)-type amino acid transporter 1 [Dissostichus eleginoides]